MLTPISIARSGFIASGNVGWPHHASGSVRSGHLSTTGAPDGSKFLRDDFSWQDVSASGAITSGDLASGTVQGFYGATRHLASGTVGVFDFGSGAVVAGAVGSGAVVSGNIGSGQLGHFHLGTNVVFSGQLGSGAAEGFFGSTRHLASGTVGVFDFGSGAVAAGTVGSGAVVSGNVASGQLGHFHLGSDVVFSGQLGSGATQGFFGATRHLASGTVGVFDFGSGAVIAGTVGSGAVVSGNIGSGQVGNFHVSSGAVTSGRLGTVGTPDGTKFLRDDFNWAPVGGGGIASGDVMSGAIASGAVQGFFGATRHIASGTIGVFDFGSGAVIAGAVGSGAVVSGNIGSGQVGSFHLADNAVTSGDVGSGQLFTYHFASGATITRAQFVAPFVSGTSWTALTEELISGTRAVHLSLSGTLRIAMAADLARMPAVGVLVANVESGIAADVHTVGVFQFASGLADYSGYLGQPLLVGRSGQVVTASGSWNSGGLLSGDVYQQLGLARNSGAPVLGVNAPSISGGVANILSGGVTSGDVGSGSIQGFFGATRHLASGTVGVFDFGSGAVVAGAVGSGAVVSGNIGSGQIGHFHLGSDVVFSGQLGSGATQGFFGSTRHLASGTVGVFDFGSGAVIAGSMGSGAVVSGNIGSGQIGSFHLADAAVRSGDVASGAVTGQAGGGFFVIASGTITTHDLGSGAIVSGLIASGQIGSFHLADNAVTSGDMASGQIFTYHFASGATATRSVFTGPFFSGTSWAALTEELISGVRAVALSQSGTLRIAMAAVSGRMPAIGIVSENVASGISADVYVAGVFQFASGLADYSGYLGQPLFVGRSGHVVTASGSWNSGGLIAGDFIQHLGTARNSGAAALETHPGVYTAGASINILPSIAGITIAAAGAALASGNVQSGHIASGAVQGFFGATRHVASGTVGMFDFGSGAVIAGTIGSGAVVSGNIGSGQVGNFHLADASVRSGDIASGAVTGQAGGGFFVIASGTITTNDVGSGAIVSGLIASGQIGSFHLADNAVTSGDVASGQLFTYHFASGATATRSVFTGPFFSGTSWTALTEELISGVRAVHISQSGTVRIAMAGVSGRMPAVGVIAENIASGIDVDVYAAGVFQFASGLADYSGYLGQPLFVGRSGQVVTASGSWNSGGLVAGDFIQHLGSVRNSGAAAVEAHPGVYTAGASITLLPSIAGISIAAAGAALASGNVQSGHIASGAVQGFFGATRHVASGTVGVFDFGSGAVIAGAVGSGAVVSGNVASGQLGHFHLGSDVVFSGQLGSGATQGFFGATRHLASGTVGVFDFGSGAVIAGTVGSGAVVSGNVASGQLGSFHFASGATITHSLALLAFWSGIAPYVTFTEEPISGVRAVAISPSGNLRIAMASMAARMPAMGIVADNVLSGESCQVYTHGALETTSGLIDMSGYVGEALFVGRSGQIVTRTGSFNSGGFISGDILQQVATAWYDLDDVYGIVANVQAPYLSGHIPGSGVVGSGVIASGAVQGFFGTVRNIASGTLGVFDLGSGAVIAGSVGSGAVVSGNIGSGQVGNFHLADAAVRSGDIASGAVTGQAGGGFFVIASGTITTHDIGSGAVVSGLVASGQLGTYHFTSGATSTRAIFTGPFFSGLPFNLSTEEPISGVRAVALSQSGTIRIAMAAVSGRMPAVGVVVENVASGIAANVYTAGVFQFTSGLVDYSGYLGQPLFVGRSGQVVTASGSWNSGGLVAGDFIQHLGTAQNSGLAVLEAHPGVYTAGASITLLPSIAGISIAAAAGGLVSGAVQSGHVASGAIQGFFGATRHIASGTVGVFDFGSGAIVAGSIGSGAVVSGNVGSGQIGHFHVASGAVGSGRIGNLAVVSGSLAPAAVWTDHIASGAIAPRAVHVNPFHVNAPYQATTEEMISGLRAVALSQSGTIRIAMAAVSGRMPAVGVVISPDDAVSGGIVTVYTHGTFQFASGLADYSGYLGQTLFVGRSGHVVTASGSWNSGGLLSGDIHQPLGTAWNSGGAVMGMGAQLPFVPGLLLSGDIASGQLDTFHMASGAAATRATQIRPVWTPQGLTAVTNEMISGFRAVAINPSGFITIAMAAVSGRMPAVGVVPENVVSGDPVTVMSVGPLPFTSGLADFSGYLGKRVWVGRSGQVTTISGSWSSAGFASGDFGQPLGVVQRSGTVIINVYPFVTSGGPLGLPVAGGF